MKIDVDEFGDLVIKELYGGAYLETAEGNRVGICMRDDTIELSIIPKDKDAGPNWWRVNMQEDTVECMNKRRIYTDG